MVPISREEHFSGRLHDYVKRWDDSEAVILGMVERGI